MTSMIKEMLDVLGVPIIKKFFKLPPALRISYPVLMTYIYSMCILPWLENGQSWEKLQKVWLEWQTINAGMVALAASVIFYHAATHQENQQAMAKLRSAKASLVATLSDWTKDSSHAARFLMAALTALKIPESDRGKINIDRKLFEFEFSQAIERCIELESQETGECIAKTPHLIQIFKARLAGEIASINGESNVFAGQETLHKLLYDLAELQVRIDRLFAYARGTELNTSYPSLQEIFNFISCQEIAIESHHALTDALTVHYRQAACHDNIIEFMKRRPFYE